MLQSSALDQLQPVHELNRAFLGLLQARARRGCPGPGLPATVAPTVAAAESALLDAVAVFPRALFQIEIGACASPRGPTDAAHFDEEEHDLCFSILFAARQASRQSAYQARLLFALDATDVERLRASSLPELQRLAGSAGVLQCAFRDRPWFWQTLFTATRPELKRQLTLLALQPSTAIRWPRRRPAQPIL